MADSAVTERRIRPIQDAIFAGNWKQALKECEKWQKKGETSDRFLALKASVLIHQPDTKNQQKGAEETLELCRRSTPVLNIEAIHQLQDSLSQLKLDAEEGPKLWERAVAARPTDKDLITTWLHNSITASSWQSAQKATMALRKAFPKERQYDFWNILMCYLIHEDSRLPDKDRRLFGTLANRMISKAAQPGPADKMISNVEELSLLAAVLTKTGSISELVQLLNSETLKPVVDQDRPFAHTLLLQALSSSTDSSEIAQAASALLNLDDSDNEPSYDDRAWSLFLRLATDRAARKTCIDSIDAALTKFPEHRRALLTKIDLLSDTQDKDEAGTRDFLTACFSHYQTYVTKAFCFDDLIERLRLKDAETVSRFADLVNEAQGDGSSPVERLFVLKLRYYQLFCDRASEDKGLSFVLSALDLYSSDKASGSVAPEAALLAALGLLWVGSITGSADYSLQANTILHAAISNFKDYYPLRVLLIQVQRMSGQIHLAMENFWHLSIKNLQWETAGHLLLERISSLHPCRHGRGEESLNPLGAFDAALGVFAKSERSLDRAIRDGLKHGSYSNVVDTVDLRNKLQRSMVRQLYRIEERKIERALGLRTVSDFDTISGGLVDLRDTSFMPTYGVAKDKLQNLLGCGPRPSEGWIAAMNLHECFMTYLLTQRDNCPSDAADSALKNMAEARAKVSLVASDLTRDEQIALTACKALADIVLHTRENGADVAASFDALNAALQDLEHEVEAPSIAGVAFPDAGWLHHQFVRLEVLQTVAHYTGNLNKRLKAAKGKDSIATQLRNACEKLQPVVSQQAETVHSEARSLKQKLGDSGVLGKIVDAAFGRHDGASSVQQALNERSAMLLDEAAMEQYCGSLRESWEGALDGILAVKLKTI